VGFIEDHLEGVEYLLLGHGLLSSPLVL